MPVRPKRARALIAYRSISAPVIEMRIREGGATTNRSQDVCCAVYEGVRFEAKSGRGASHKLARVLVAAGIPDAPWRLVRDDTGTECLSGGSFHHLARWTVSELTTPKLIPFIQFVRAAAVLAMLITTPALAWTNTNNGHNNQIVDGGPGAQANQHQSARSNATGGNAQGGNASVTNNLALGGGGGNATGWGGRAPDVVLPSIGGGGMDCPTVGFGAGGSGLGGGGGIGPSWISSDCNKRRVADLLAHLYGASVAQAYAEKNIDGVKEAVEAAAARRVEYPYDWCATRDAGNRRQREVCEGKR